MLLWVVSKHTSLVCLFGCAAFYTSTHQSSIMQALKRLQGCQQVCRIVDSGVHDDRFFIILEVSTLTYLPRS